MAKQLKGDINNDGKIDLIDAYVCLKASEGGISLDTEEAARADVNEDGRVDAHDVVRIFQHNSGLIIIDGVI